MTHLNATSDPPRSLAKQHTDTNESHTGEKSTTTPGALAISNLIAGQPAGDLSNLSDPWRDIAHAIVNRRNGKSAGETFEAAITGRPDANEFRKAVINARHDDDRDDEASEPLLLETAVPELPDSAKLKDSQLKNIDSAGQWLTDYISFARIASPMSAIGFHEMLGLTLLAASIARRVMLPVSAKRIFPNLYSLLVAPSTRYRKTSAFDIAHDTLERADLRRLLLPARMSPESLMQELTGRTPGDFGQWEKIDQDEWQNERPFAAQRAWLMEEASSLLDSFKQEHSAGLLPIVLDLHDSPNSRAVSTIGRGRQTVRRAYLTICGPTTPASLKPHLANSAYWGNGLWARFIFVIPNERPTWQFWPKEESIPDALTSQLKTLALDRLAVPKEEVFNESQPVEPLSVILADGVWERWESYAKALEYELLENIPARFHANYGRFATFAIKTAILLATADWAIKDRKPSPTVKMQHWARAQMITEQWRANLHRLAELQNREGEEEDLTTRILKYLPKGAIRTPSEIARDLGRTESHQILEIKTMLALMKDEGLVEPANRKPKRGPAAKGWRKA